MQVACRPPSLRSCIYILDPLLEVPQCSGEGAGHTQGFGLPLLLPEVSSAAQKVPDTSLAWSVTCFHPSSFGTGTRHSRTSLPVTHPELAARKLLANALHTAKRGGSAPLHQSSHRAETPLSSL